ncbi:MAG: sensor histidine kinase [Cystobacterineae bacterium]|nr:sensor histidine kinase [Cystobacterineae bacterium]
MFIVPTWNQYFKLSSPIALGIYVGMWLYSLANYTVLHHPVAGRISTYLSLCLDLVFMVLLFVQSGKGNLENPLLATQLLFTMFFVLLFPKPISILPPLLVLPITLRLDQLLQHGINAIDVLTLFWYLALNFVILYVLVYLNGRETLAHKAIVQLQDNIQKHALAEERNRLAREIHDGLGATLSSLIFQSEYLLQLSTEEKLSREISELKSTAENSIEELRRSVKMMRGEFNLTQSLGDYAQTFAERSRLNIQFKKNGIEKPLSSSAQLALFRVLQESLSNVAKHAQAQTVIVELLFLENTVSLSVTDDGKGFNPSQPVPGHYGLIHLRERALNLDGNFNIHSSPEQGTQIHFSLPLSTSS